MYRHPSPLRRPSQQPTKPSRQSSYPGSTTAPSDPLYGHGETALLCQRFIRALFNCPDRPPPSATQPSTPTPPLAQFVAYSLHRTRLHPSVTFTALFLLSRLKSRFPQARGSSGHRLFISAFMIASKVVCDDTYSNKSWTVVGQGMFSLREINQMEREMCGYLEWQLNVDPKELRDFEIRVRKDYALNGPCPPFVHPPQPTPTSTTPTVGEDVPPPVEIPPQLPTQSQSGPITPPASPQRLPVPPPVAVHPPAVHVRIPTASTTPPLGAQESPSPQSSGGCLTPQSDDEDRDDTTIVSMGPEFPSDDHPSRTHSAMSISSAASLPPKSKLGRDQSFAFPSRTVW